MSTAPYAFHPYCGSPPDPHALWSRWNLDPALLTILALAALAYALLAHHVGPPPARRLFFWSGFSVLALALVSPLCALSVSLFSARIGQHLILTGIAAPLIALARPLPLPKTAPFIPALAFGLAMWVWHAPGPYAATFDGPYSYWLMHLSLIGSAWWLADALIESAPTRPAAVVAAAALTSAQMGLLGAVLTFAPRPIFTPHFTTTWAWALSPMQDQALGGAIMWVPAGLVIVAAIMATLASAFSRAETRASARAGA